MCEPLAVEPGSVDEYDRDYENRTDNTYDNPSLGARTWRD
jgi:hypothetical protein